MRIQYLACLLLASFAYGQATRSATPLTTINKAPKVQVGPDDPVITVNGFCANPIQQGNSCKTVITREQFEKLIEALQPGMSLSLRLKVANAYANNLRMSAAAKKLGLDKTSAFEEEMQFACMQLLSQDLVQTLRTEANNISDDDIEDYYKKNRPSYEEATLERIFVPPARQIIEARKEHANSISVDAQSVVLLNADAKTDTKMSATQQTEVQEKVAEDAVTKFAADLRTRAANGEDPDNLQLVAYRAAGIQGTAFNTKMEKVRRAMLPVRHEMVLDMKPGEVSEVFSDPDGAYFIYKMISKEILTLDEVKTEIRTAISSQRYRDSMKSFQGDVVFDDDYFNPPVKSDAEKSYRK